MGALSGLRVVECGVLIQAPLAAHTLGLFGADVIKVELPGGEGGRNVPGIFIAGNRGKRAIELDLRVPEGRDVFRRLAERADIVITNFALGTMERFGLDYATLSATNSGLIMANANLMGPVGRHASRAGIDIIAQAEGGLLTTFGPEGTATPVGVHIADYIASQNLVVALLAALAYRSSTDLGQYIETSLLGGQIHAQSVEYVDHMTIGPQGRAVDAHPTLRPFVQGIVPTADGHLAFAARPGGRDELFDRIGRSDLKEVARFHVRSLEPEVRDELFAILHQVFRSRTTEEWIATLTGADDVVYGTVRNHADVIADEHSYDNGYLIHDANATPPIQPGSPFRMSLTPTEVATRVPEIGEHTEEVLLELGYSWDDIDNLRLAGAI